jgi:hypothetical protein
MPLQPNDLDTESDDSINSIPSDRISVPKIDLVSSNQPNHKISDIKISFQSHKKFTKESILPQK